VVVSARSLGCVSLVQLLQSEEATPETMVEDGAHSQRLLEAAYRFKIDNRFTDVTINCQVSCAIFLLISAVILHTSCFVEKMSIFIWFQGQPVANCHRLILCAYSDHFEAALSTTENCPMVTLDIDSAITGVTSLDLRTMVDFMYTGALRAAKRRLKSLSAAARALGVSKLFEVLTMGDTGHSHRGPSHSHRDSSSMGGGGESSSAAFVESVAPVTEADFDVDAVGATEDVGSSAMDHSK
jgi:hypothetical protein